MRRTLASGMLALLLAAALAGGADRAAPVAVEYPNVGLSLAIPEGFEYQQPVEPTEVLRAVRTEPDQPAQSIRLSVFVVDKQQTAETFSAERVSQLEAAVAVRDLEVLKETKMPVASAEGLAQRLRYSCRGENMEAAAVCFLRDLPSDDYRLCYLLSVKCASEHVDKLLPTLGSVVKSIAFVAIRRPSDAPIGPAGPAISNVKAGYVYRPPVKWFASQLGADLVAGQIDYTRPELAMDGVALPQLRVVAAAVEAGTSSQASAKQDSQVTAQVLSEGAAKLAGRDAYQFIVLQSPKAQPVTQPATQPTTQLASTAPASTQPAKSDEPLTIAQRTLCVQSGDKRVSYSLILRCPGGDGKVAEAMLEELAGGFSLPEPPAPAATRPTTSPSAEK